MDKNKSLVEIKEGKFQKFLNSLKKCFSIFGRKENKKINADEYNTKNISVQDDIDILEKLVKGKIKSSSIDYDTQKRIKVLCAKREKQIREKIRINNEKIAMMDKMIFDIREIRNS